jgi:hypothetical protein
MAPATSKDLHLSQNSEEHCFAAAVSLLNLKAAIRWSAGYDAELLLALPHHVVCMNSRPLGVSSGPLLGTTKYGVELFHSLQLKVLGQVPA